MVLRCLYWEYQAGVTDSESQPVGQSSLPVTTGPLVAERGTLHVNSTALYLPNVCQTHWITPEGGGMGGCYAH